MNYQRIYDELIDNARNRDSFNGIFERHHIIPRSMGGGDEPENLVILSMREHYMAHWLLYKIHKSKAMAHAWNFMASIYGSHTSERYTSHKFKYAREAFIRSRSTKSPDEDLSEPYRSKRRGNRNGGSKAVKATCVDTSESIIFDSAVWAAKCIKGDQSTISRCCAKTSSMHKGYYWEYAESHVKSTYVKGLKIKRTDPDGNIEIFNDLNDAVSNTEGTTKARISECSRGNTGRRHHAGYIWEYISE